LFRVPLSALRRQLEAQGIEASWTMAAAAAEYRESLAIAKRLEEDPMSATEWLRHQASFEPSVMPDETEQEEPVLA
jgi:hypothetical protein